MRMRVRDFMPLVQDLTFARLPAELRDCTARIRSAWLQLHYHSPQVHYEVWLARKIERIEIGLHFEGPREFSYRWAEQMAQHMLEIQARLGPRVELEEWTASWTRIHQTLPYDPLTEPLAEEVASRLAGMITVLQPIVAAERPNIPPPSDTPARNRKAAVRRSKSRPLADH